MVRVLEEEHEDDNDDGDFMRAIVLVLLLVLVLGCFTMVLQYINGWHLYRYIKPSAMSQ